MSSIHEYDISRLESIAMDLAIRIEQERNEDMLRELIRDLESLNLAINLLR